ncbi:MAG: hypothetical protein K2M76_01040 [Muribaculaceae bacterium]|nr:hypothetical protein [Muribaculaceae bacterium]
MANKRDLKKEIRYICGDLAGECLVARELMPGVDFNAANNIIIEVAALQSATLSKVTFDFDKTERDFDSAKSYRKARHAYYAAAYKKLKEDFNVSVEGILRKMNGLLSKEQREANKLAAK